MTDKFRIDEHKYSFHPVHASKVVNYIVNPKDENAINEYRLQHPLYIEVSPVGACNHRCTFCAVDYIGYKSTFMDLDIYKASLNSMIGKGTKSIMFAGEGEPLLHPEISEMVNHTKEVCRIDTSFTTNAFKLSKDFIQKSMHNISWIKVSFNGGNADVYSSVHRTKSTDFDVVLSNIKEAIDYRNKYKLNTVIGFQTLLLPENAGSINDLCKLAKSIGADYVVIKPYSQHKFSKTHMYEDIDYTEYLSLGEELDIYNSDSFNVVFRVNTIKNWLSQNDQRYCRCLATPSTWAYWMADGSVYSCSAYLLDQRFNLGNINSESFDEIWTSDTRIKHSQYVLNDLNIEECRVNCRMDQVNRYLDSIVNENVPHLNFI